MQHPAPLLAAILALAVGLPTAATSASPATPQTAKTTKTTKPVKSAKLHSVNLKTRTAAAKQAAPVAPKARPPAETAAPDYVDDYASCGCSNN